MSNFRPRLGDHRRRLPAGQREQAFSEHSIPLACPKPPDIVANAVRARQAFSNNGSTEPSLAFLQLDLTDNSVCRRPAAQAPPACDITPP